MSRIAVFPGSFSPFTLGHKSVVDRSLPLFDKIIIAIGINSEKNEYFSIEEKEKWIKDIYKDNPKIEVQFYEGLTVDFCEKEEAKYILRGLRDSHDFKYEKNIAQTNKNLNPKLETIFVITPPEMSHISSTIMRDIIKNGGDVSQFLPKEIDL
ncbi:MAG: pantetheine-phosphate adenylyltransferase [Flavobacteriales bacterium]|nr:pantetheine-phosphate adenylyltransferase [Flavobacteriales bacterium]MBT6699531.1 pantetheine-phosphate adenylyltransferase [Flavobacteriales bacterium]MBT7620205.1 pantetheine-phosphate adenylyltransferase [Flavobacteriales bacterium]